MKLSQPMPSPTHSSLDPPGRFCRQRALNPLLVMSICMGPKLSPADTVLTCLFSRSIILWDLSRSSKLSFECPYSFIQGPSACGPSVLPHICSCNAPRPLALACKTPRAITLDHLKSPIHWTRLISRQPVMLIDDSQTRVVW